MPITNYGKNQMSARIGSNIASPQYVSVGTGSAQVSSASSGLITTFTRAQFNSSGSINYANLPQISSITDFSSVTMSGCNMTEFGVFDLSSGGKAWQVERFASTNFDGTQELSCEIQWYLY